MRKLAILGAVCALTALSQTGCVALVAGGAVGTGAVMAADSRSAGTMVDDKAIELKASRVLSNNREIYEASRLEATSVNGRVLVTGQCQDASYLTYIEQRLSKIDQVREVIDQVEKIAPVDFGQRSTDSWITTKVKTQLLFGEDINSGRFKVITENGVVYLIGLVTKDEAARAVNVARQISGVRKVVKIFDYISADSQVAKVIRGDKVQSVAPAGTATAPVEAAGHAITTEDTPMYFEESSLIEQPVTTSGSLDSQSNVVTGTIDGVTPSTSTNVQLVQPIQTETPTNTVQPGPSSLVEDDSIIIE